MNTDESWPAGQTWVFQGTVVEDATAGTHISTLVVSPGAGNEMQLSGGHILVGNTATAQTPSAFIDDGTNVIMWLLNPEQNSLTTALVDYPVPTSGVISFSTLAADANSPGWVPVVISGTMRLVLRVSTTAVSVTQTFAVVCRIRGTVPTATLADTVGTPTLTTNTNRVF